jgi:hypothetical protein
MHYALLAYRRGDSPRPVDAPIDDSIAAVLARTYVTGWARLHADESATTVRNDDGRTLLTDGPFIDSKEYLAGVIVIDAGNLDEALTVAQELQDIGNVAAIEVRPIMDGLFGGA